MSTLKWLFLSVPLVALAEGPPEAAACGAYLHGASDNTQVTGHRMIFSISPTETTLWDQLSYSGDPSSFAWVLPVKGNVEIGVSSDALFQVLDQETGVTVVPGALSCPAPPDCYEGYYSTGGSGGAGGSGGGDDVMIAAQSVVGPYETVTLHSTDPNALTDWLASHGYVLPADFAPVVTAYVQEGFDFVAIKLVPGQGVTAMKPVRVTTLGAGATLPLRMVAGGAGAIVPITLWVFGEGRYEPKSSPSFSIYDGELIWDYSTHSSNYTALRQAGLTAGNGDAWLLETSSSTPTWGVTGPIDNAIALDPVSSGYGDALGNGAQTAANADYQKLWGNLGGAALWLTRMHAELPRAALAIDLTLALGPYQAAIPGAHVAGQAINSPACPTYDCDTSDGCGGSGPNGCPGEDTVGGACGCTTVGSESKWPATLTAAAVALGAARARRRRRAARRADPTR